MTLADELAASAREGQTFTPGLWKGDTREWLRRMGDNRAHAIITDPPYGLSAEPDPAAVLRSWLAEGDFESTAGGFMGQRWDSFVPGPATWRALWRVLRPGGHCLVFAGTRTADWMTLALRLAGFEIRDVIMWTYGSGFPKGIDVGTAIDKAAGAERETVGPRVYGDGQTYDGGARSGRAGGSMSEGVPRVGSLKTAPATDDARQWEGWNTALKPAYEPVIVARKPLRGTVAANVVEWEAGALNIDACRVGVDGGCRDVAAGGWVRDGSDTFDSIGRPGAKSLTVAGLGRWPANLVLSCACDDDRNHDPGCPVRHLDEQSGVVKSGSRKAGAHKIFGGGAVYGATMQGDLPAITGDSGGASRFFYCAKAPSSQRPDYIFERSLFTAGELAVWEAEHGQLPPDGTKVAHPTVKPLDLMRWLCRLVTPAGGLIVDPFLGSGSTAEAATAEGFRWAGAERNLPYWPLIEQRVARASSGMSTSTRTKVR